MSEGVLQPCVIVAERVQNAACSGVSPASPAQPLGLHYSVPRGPSRAMMIPPSTTGYVHLRGRPRAADPCEFTQRHRGGVDGGFR